MTNNQENTKNIIFLGAGSSSAEGAPSQKGIFKKYSNSQNNKEEINDFFEDFFGIRIDDEQLDNEYPTFEEVLGMIDLALRRKESFSEYEITPKKPKLQKIRESLIFLIAEVLRNSLRDINGYHKKLVEKLKEKNDLKNTTFISLNYDIIIDNALIREYPEHHLNYKIDFRNFEEEPGWEKPKSDKSVNLLKLHGSLNWLYCPTCISLKLTPKRKEAAKLAREPSNCPECNCDIVPIIIPPTFFKVMSNYYLQRIWHEAEKELKEADRIVFAGYSLPKADIHIKYLMKRIEINSKKNPDIYVVNNYEEKKEDKKEKEKRKYHRFFKNKINYTDKSFENLAKSGLEGI